MADAESYEYYGVAWVEFRDEDTRRYLGKINVRTGELVIPHRGKECRFDVSHMIKAIVAKECEPSEVA